MRGDIEEESETREGESRMRKKGRGVRQWEKRGRKETRETRVRGDIKDERETVRRGERERAE